MLIRIVSTAIALLFSLAWSEAVNAQESEVSRPTHTEVVLGVSPDCQEPYLANACPLFDVSIVQLLADPTKFDGKRVRVIGYIHFEFEGDAIYLHEEDEKHGLTRNGFWVSLAAGVQKETCQDKYAVVEGTFSARDRGHMGLWSGALLKITRCDEGE